MITTIRLFALVALSALAPAQDVIVVLLEQPQTKPGSEQHLDAVDEVQQVVLERLEDFGADVDLRYRYENFAAFSAVLDKRALEILESDPLVVRFGPDLEGQTSANTAVPFLRGDLAHEIGGGTSRGEGVIVAVLDSGVDSDHLDLVSSLTPGAFRFTQQGADVGPGAEDGLGHGTNVTGIIASDGVIAPLGIAPSAQILPVQVIADDGTGWLSDWAAGVDYAITQKSGALPGLSILNMSLGTFATYNDCPCDTVTASVQVLGTAVSAARTAGIATFASSGNSGTCTRMSAPGCLADAISVASVHDRNLGRVPASGTYRTAFGTSFPTCFDADAQPNRPTCYSNLGPCSNLAAPGYAILSTGRFGGTSTYNGTSQASPFAAGVAALAQATASGGSSAPALAPDALETLLQDTGFDLDLTGFSCSAASNLRRVDALSAVAAASPFELYCFGDGGDGSGCTPCPCANDGPANTPGGCTNPSGTNAMLVARGTASITADTLRFEVRRASPASFGLLISGDNRLPDNGPCQAGSGVTGSLLDGLRCVGGNFLRHGSRSTNSMGHIGNTNAGWGAPDGPNGGVSAQSAFSAGQTREFQVFYRVNAAAGCGTGQATTNAATVTFSL